MSGRFWQFQQLTDSLKGQSHVDRIPLPSTESTGALHIGGLAAFHQDPSPLDKAGITHVVTVVDFDIPSVANQLSKYKHLRIDVADQPEENLLKHFPRTNAFIDAAQREGGSVFVHCAMGVSRSATIVAAFVMWKHNLGRDEALRLLKEGRPGVRPNAGFMEQLQVWEQMVKQTGGWDAELYQQWKNRPRVKL